ncbi:unnamed protein product [Bursaphelenchus okinawaensis]|uniref:G_PROTEIN_RECEP_F1_2 domain-containing protein n=1 Tax=Bursaphelenchus okinawaensis TaxID=465554 RepID=A0A811LRG2_9BILA|nr:unnamed protein product [Bursaphelenchus okinawaensis]CAG9128175.1 unnamed protein product [Bursaphelenchus okinawaensis]
MPDAAEVFAVLKLLMELLMFYVLILAYYFNKKLDQTALIHYNLKLILRNIGIIFPIINISRFFSYGWAYVMQAGLISPVQANVVCLVSRFIEDVGLGCCATLIIQITLERTAATLMRKTYEKKGAHIGWLITGQTFFMAICFTISNIVYDVIVSGKMKLEKRYVGCRLDQFHLFMYLMVFVSAFLCSVIAASALFYIYRYCLKKLSQMTEMKLSTRYQYSENIACIKALLPPMMFYVITASSGVYVTIFVYTNFWEDEQIEENRDLIDAHLMVLHIIGQLYAIGAMTCFLMSFKPLRQNVAQDFQCCFRKKSVEPDDTKEKADVVKREENVDYFKMMNKTWQ